MMLWKENENVLCYQHVWKVQSVNLTPMRLYKYIFHDSKLKSHLLTVLFTYSLDISDGASDKKITKNCGLFLFVGGCLLTSSSTLSLISFPVTTGCHSSVFPLWISAAQYFQDTPAGRLMASQTPRSRTATAILSSSDTESQPAVKAPDQSVGGYCLQSFPEMPPCQKGSGQ